ncbi:hypothetical protein ACFYNZ_16850 [Streptomyces kebangsaanensis]|uniref:Response regulator n=1 Tax=Streptomyces kebangsaanensis TaxID=864058 RepID=A0ABW6KTF2_9ACTN
MRFLIVDDLAEKRDARKMWLMESRGAEAELPVTECESLDFEQARALGEDWLRFDCLVVDAHDDRPTAFREARAREVGVPYRSYDRFPGRDVVLAARQHHPELVIIVTSYYASSESMVAKQFAEAGAKYLFGSHQVPDREAFVAVVTNPSNHNEAVRYAKRRSTRTAEICELMASATDEKINAVFVPGRTGPRQRSRQIGRFANRLKDLLDVPQGGGIKSTYRQRLRVRLRQFFGAHLPNQDPPVDPGIDRGF